jgi:Protein of unknown function (DUF3185)
MNRGLSVALLVAGVILLGFGISASHSMHSDVSRFFTGSLTDKAIWMIIGGVVVGIVGLVGVTRRA